MTNLESHIDFSTIFMPDNKERSSLLHDTTRLFGDPIPAYFTSLEPQPAKVTCSVPNYQPMTRVFVKQPWDKDYVIKTERLLNPYGNEKKSCKTFFAVLADKFLQIANEPLDLKSLPIFTKKHIVKDEKVKDTIPVEIPPFMVVRAIGNKSEKGHTRTREKSKEIPLTKNSTNETSIKSGQSSISPPKRSNTEGKTLENPVTKKFKTSPAVPDNSVRTSLSASPKRKIKDPIEHDVKRLRSSSAEELKSTEPETKASSTPVAVDMKDSSQHVIETPSFDSLSVRDWQKLARVAKTHAAELCKKGPNSNIHKGSICFAFATLCYFSELAKTGTTSGEFASRLDNIRKFKKSIDLYLLKPQVEHRKIYSLLTFCEVHFLNVAYRSINRDLNDKLRLITNIKSLQVETKSSQLANEKASYDKMLTEQSLRIGHLQESLRMAFGMSLSHSKETDLNHFSCDPFKTNFNINAFSTDSIEVDHEALELAGRQLMELALDRQVDLTFTKQDDNFFMPSI